MALMRLVERGAVSMNETMGDLFSPVILPERWQSVSVTQLLTHTSGFAADRDRWFNDTYDSCFDAFRRIVQRDAPSGAGYEYSNTNFCALSLAIGSLSGPSYDDAVFRLVLRPLGIARKRMDPEYANLSGAGGWRMSALDVGRIVSGIDPNARLSPLSPAIRTQMIQRTSYNYGLGVWIWDPDTYGHSGSLYRARSIAVRLPSGRVAVILTQATFPESGLDLLPIAQRIDSAFASSCADSPCEFLGIDPFNAMPTGIRGRAQV
jgi:CubicO group peptidase (beta-lactamase class C family)